MLGESFIEYEKFQRDLGVIIHSKLLWAYHANNLTSIARSKLGLLMRTCHFTISINKRQKRSFFLTIVRSLFEHCSVIWSPQHKNLISKFDMIQKRAIKWIDGHPFDSYTHEQFFIKQREYDILPIKRRFWLNDLKLLYKIINGLVPIALPDYITFAEATQFRHTRRTAAIIGGCDTTTLYCSIRPNCDAFRDGFFYRALKAWNNLPVDIRQAEGVSSFKGKLIDRLWSASNDWPD